ncbi:hypothetical protein CNYM01_00652 [Colletotrichum nymphaeae SA-01]|uniref:Heterokaryon incompatibility domain-containing protein n=1 Tax=Colletotrichum nymphaeae SA-01 TaxID=1460502 RepID=A0A135TEB7_9PEZI|nr:hypothetical protein CNYM01_00652 [Colletotrichum nymphaeae SA-01]
MSRWHADWCTSPIIQVGDDQIPRCEKCQTSAHARLKAADRPNPVLVAPKDEEYGSLNLTWPPTVTFTSGENVTHPAADKSKDDQEAQPAPCHSSDSAVVGHGTVTALSSDEFRLAVLHAVGDRGKSYPIHVDLESHKDTHFPDYDAVSYTWGDENGDAERCHPIYAGDHWDIIFQTKNCCDVLRYLRPSRGLKLIWIDAICIDQNNAEERATQVAKMGQIYSRCSQVWAWMGDDLVSDNREGLPERRLLHELGTAHDYAVTSSQSQPIEYSGAIEAALTKSENDSAKTRKVSWKKTGAPWFEHIAQGHIDGLGLWDMMALTSKSHASDFRDKLYGILGLLSFGSNKNLPQPNYAISARQMVVGFIAHCMINEGKPQVLLAAQGYSAQKDPSWLPAWETQESWEQSFVELPDLAYYSESERRVFGREHRKGTSKHSRPDAALKHDYFLRRGIVFISKSRHAEPPDKTRSDELKRYPRYTRNNLCLIPAWDRDFTVDKDTGSISVWLTRLASTSSTPAEALKEVFDDLTLYRIHFGPGQWFLVGSQHPLDRLLQHDDELFALDPELGLSGPERKRLVYMVLRKTGDGRNDRYLADIQGNFCVAQEKLYIQAKLDKSVYDVEERSRCALDDNVYIFPLLFPGNENTTVGHILPILTGHEGFERLQENELCAARGQKVMGDYLEFEFEIDFGFRPSGMKKGKCQAENAWRTFHTWMEWEWRKPGEENRLLWQGLPQLQYESNETHEDLGLPGGMMRIHLRCRLEAVREVIAFEARLLGITLLWESRMFGDTLEAFEKNIRSEVTEEDFLIPGSSPEQRRHRSWPEEFDGLDGGIYRVCIV